MSGHAFEKRIQDDAKESGIFCHRIKTRMSGFANDNEPGDFILAGAKGNTLLLEAKSTQEYSLPFSMIRPNQYVGLLEANGYDNVYGGILVEMRRHAYQVFYIPVELIKQEIAKGNMSIDLTNHPECAIIKSSGVMDLKELLESLGRRHKL